MLRINGGPAHSGTVVKREAPPKVWTHDCTYEADGLWITMDGVVLTGHWTRCPDCGTKRP